MAIASVGSRPIAILSMVVLARLLSPDDFGDVALAMVLFSTMNLFSGLGMPAALIHSKRKTSETAFMSFVVAMLFSISLWGVINAAPTFFANLLGDEDLIPVLRWLSLLILIDGLVLTPKALLKKEMKFGSISKAMLAASIVQNACAVALAFAGFGLWSLVWGRLLGSTTQLVIVWLSYRGWDWLIPRPWNLQILRELLHYGVRSMGGGLMSFFNSHWDDWLVGRVLGTTALGFYDRAYRITNGTIARFNRGVINGVLFPSYTKIQDDKRRLARAYLKSLGMSSLIMAPLSMGMLAVSVEFVPVVFGEKWIPMTTTLQIFSFMALVRPLAGSTSPIFQAVGRPEFNMRAGIVITATMVPMVYLFLGWGIEGVAMAVTLSYFIAFFYNVYQINLVLTGISGRIFTTILPSLIASAVMVGAVLAIKALLLRVLDDPSNGLLLMTMTAAGVATYMLAALMLQRTLIIELSNLFLSLFQGCSRIPLIGKAFGKRAI